MTYANEIHGVDNKMGEYLAGWQRARAELANFRKRMAEEQALRDKQAKQRIIEDLIPLLDNFRVMVLHLPAEMKEDQWVQGVLHIAKQLEQLLEDYSVSPIEAEGEKFDPSLHEAVEYVPETKADSGFVSDVLQRGYMMDGEVIRPAKVKVAK